MTYNVELDIDANAIDMVEEFATGHGCTHKIIGFDSDNNQVIQFSSDKFSYLEELIGQLLGYTPDEEALKTMVWES